jgi:hypothetical protein
MHSVIINDPAIFPSPSQTSVTFQTFSLLRSLQIFRTVVLQRLLEYVAVIILVLIPWNTAS